MHITRSTPDVLVGWPLLQGPERLCSGVFVWFGSNKNNHDNNGNVKGILNNVLDSQVSSLKS